MGVRTRERRNFDYLSGLSIPSSPFHLHISYWICASLSLSLSLNSEALARPWRGSGRDNPRANLSANNSPKGMERKTQDSHALLSVRPSRPVPARSFPLHTAVQRSGVGNRDRKEIRFKSIRSRDRDTRTEYTVWMCSDVCVCVGVCRWTEYCRQREEERNSNVQYWTVPLISLSAGSRAQLIYS